MHKDTVNDITLLIDADDTLWENNVYFLEVTEHFLDAVERAGVPRDRAARELTETERRNVPVYGYGSRAFALSVAEALERLAPDVEPGIVDSLVRLAHGIFEREQLEILPGVKHALELLAGHHSLILLTKGDAVEQQRKVDRSGLKDLFDSVEIVPEKSTETYRDLIARLGLRAERTWMIGNSPRSDINPALSAGLNAILVPHPHTWELEVEDVAGYPERLVVVDTFGDIVALFLSARDGDSS